MEEKDKWYVDIIPIGCTGMTEGICEKCPESEKNHGKKHLITSVSFKIYGILRSMPLHCFERDIDLSKLKNPEKWDEIAKKHIKFITKKYLIE